MTDEVQAAGAAAQDPEVMPAAPQPPAQDTDVKPPAPNAPEIPAAAAAAHTDAAAQDDPMAKAVAHGYVEPQPVSKEQRARMLVAAVEHAMENNAPMTQAMLAELKALFFGE